MGILIGLVVTLGCVLGGFMAMGGHIDVLMQPWEAVIICGAALGTFLVANPMATVKDTGKACLEAFKQAVPKERDYLETLGVLHSLMRELRTKSRSEVEAHIDNPEEIGDLPGVSDSTEETRSDAFHLRLLPHHHHRQCALA